MIDRIARDEYSLLLRRFFSGGITNFDYEKEFDSIPEEFDADDWSIIAIYQAIWPCYCDLSKHKMTGKNSLTAEGKKTVARFILFLHTDYPYEWPKPKVEIGMALLRLLTFGLFGKRAADDSDERTGDDEVWPFFRKEDYDEALKQPKFLSGKGQQKTAANLVNSVRSD